MNVNPTINFTGVPVVPVFMAPSVTPAEDHNPAIRLVKYDGSTGTSSTQKKLDLLYYSFAKYLSY